MKVLYLFFFGMLFFSCKKEVYIPYLPERPIVGRWLLTDVNSDMGDGTMTGWNALPGPTVTLEFHEDGKFRCITDNEGHAYLKKFDSYVLDTITDVRTTIIISLVTPDRNDTTQMWPMTIEEKTLELGYRCIEACYYRFKRQNASSR